MSVGDPAALSGWHHQDVVELADVDKEVLNEEVGAAADADDVETDGVGEVKGVKVTKSGRKMNRQSKRQEKEVK